MRTFIIILALALLCGGAARTCEAHSVHVATKERPETHDEHGAHVFFDFTVEQQSWDEMDALEAHALHDGGHHFNNRTHEEFYHFLAGFSPAPRWTVTADMPWVVRGSIEIEDHDRLGEKEESQGIGDLQVLAAYELFELGEGHLGLIGGVKAPTGSTDELNSSGVPFEPELQPGTGSTDFPAGITWHLPAGAWDLSGNVLYVVTTEGANDFEHGDAFSASLFADYPVWAGVRAGISLNYEHEAKEVHDGEKLADSGGDTILAGPMATWAVSTHVSFTAGLLVPVLQDLGGVHQELDYSWQAGGGVAW